MGGSHLPPAKERVQIHTNYGLPLIGLEAGGPSTRTTHSVRLKCQVSPVREPGCLSSVMSARCQLPCWREGESFSLLQFPHEKPKLDHRSTTFRLAEIPVLHGNAQQVPVPANIRKQICT